MRFFLTPCLMVVLAASTAFAADDVPTWVTAAATRKAPVYPASVTAVVLFQEESLTVDPDGRRVMRERGAIRILQRGGETLSASRSYDSKSGRIRDFQGWLIPPTGKPTIYGKDRIVDAAVSEGLYDELRLKVLECGNASPGSVFAWEVTEEEKTVFTQYEYAFQERLPVLTSRFSLTLPAGWEFSAAMMNRELLEPKRSGNSATWELLDLPQIEDEDYSPSLSALIPRVVLGYFPPAGSQAGLRALKDWTAVSTWLTSLVDPAVESSEPIRAKAAQLAAGSASEIEKIRAVAAFVQHTRYVAVSLNVTRGGGYTPRRASEVLARNYGDCKDKATLMRALLRGLGIEAYLATIAADDRTYVRPEWASPLQFNHAIVAIKISGATTAAAIVESKTLGRLLMFDPTDSITPVGDLPLDEQGSYALIVAGAEGTLVQMPFLPAATNRVDSSVTGALNDVGLLNAQVKRTYYGQSGVAIRAAEKSAGGAEFKKRFERSYSRRLPGSALSRVSADASRDDSSVVVNIDLTADRFGQIMQGRLFIVRPGVLTSGGEYYFTSKQRTTPMKLDADLRHDSIRIKLPAGLRVDELPSPARIVSAYGALESTWSVQNGEIVMEETFEIRETLVPASEYAKVREFFDLVGGAHSVPVVFVKQ